MTSFKLRLVGNYTGKDSVDDEMPFIFVSETRIAVPFATLPPLYTVAVYLM